MQGKGQAGVKLQQQQQQQQGGLKALNQAHKYGTLYGRTFDTEAKVLYPAVAKKVNITDSTAHLERIIPWLKDN